jgi:tRNA threonylcarbamoyladenosine biosynthesis protein TsaE
MLPVTTHFISSSEADTIKFGRSLAAALEPGDILCFSGDLGAGKTHLIKGIAGGLGVPENQVNSPTFTLIHEYMGQKPGTLTTDDHPADTVPAQTPSTHTPPADKPFPVYHFDAYRLRSTAEALEIGAEDYLYGQGVCLIEWPEKMAGIIPPEAVHVTLEKRGPNEREIRISSWVP